MSTAATISSLSSSTRRKVYAVADRIPLERRKAFVGDVGDALSDIKDQHPDTLTYALMGWILGEVIDNVLVIPIPFKEERFKILFDHASTIGGVVGFLKGNRKDRERGPLEGVERDIQEDITRQISEALTVAYEKHRTLDEKK